MIGGLSFKSIKCTLGKLLTSTCLAIESSKMSSSIVLLNGANLGGGLGDFLKYVVFLIAFSRLRKPGLTDSLSGVLATGLF